MSEFTNPTFVGHNALPSTWTGGCGCWTCTNDRVASSAYPWSMPFIVCPDCGNKRCPKATQHDLACTGSNDTDQPGSRYATRSAPTTAAGDDGEGVGANE